MADRLLTRADLMERWSISKSQFERLKARGELPPFIAVSDRVHRWKESVVAEWEDNSRNQS